MIRISRLKQSVRFLHKVFKPPIIKYEPMKFPKLANSNHNNLEPDKQKNLNNLIQQLQISIPNFLQTTIPKKHLSNQIYLRVCPLIMNEAYLPKLHGIVIYYSSMKLIQLIMTKFILNSNIKLHITSLKFDQKFDSNCIFPNCPKIYLRWSTCETGCSHLNNESTINIKYQNNLQEFERVLSGIFIFELDEDCNKILVHTIENLNIIEKLNPEEQSALNVC